MIVVSDVASDVFAPVGGLSFTPPSITSFAGPGAGQAPTIGGAVVITGQNFGPAALNALDSVVYVTQPCLVLTGIFPCH